MDIYDPLLKEFFLVVELLYLPSFDFLHARQLLEINKERVAHDIEFGVLVRSSLLVLGHLEVGDLLHYNLRSLVGTVFVEINLDSEHRQHATEHPLALLSVTVDRWLGVYAEAL